MKHTCLYEERWGEILTNLKIIKDKLCKHVEEGEKVGGWRDRLLVAEREIAVLRTSIWKIGIVSGLIGALLGNIAPGAIALIAKWLTKT